MKRQSLRRFVALGAVAGLIAAIAPVGAAQAADEPSFPSTSPIPVYLLDQNTNVTIPKGTQLDWAPASGAALSPAKSNAIVTNLDTVRLPAPTDGAVQWVSFMSVPGEEMSVANWKAYSDKSDLDGVGASLAEVAPGALAYGQPLVVKATGGTYSLGVAYVKNNGLTAVVSYYTTINVDAGAGTWKFATPVEAVAKVDTTTSVSAPAVAGSGSSVTLTATVTPASGTATPSGNVEFFDGADSLGTTATAAGEAVLSTNSLSVGSHSIKAVYAGDNSFNSSTSAVSTITVNDAEVGPEETALVAGNDGGFTASVNGALVTLTVPASLNGKLVNVFGYSSPTFLGQYTVNAGSITVPASVLGGGDHKIAVVDAADGTTILGWAQFTLSAQGGTGTRDLEAAVARSIDGEFKLIAPDNTTPAQIGNATLVGGQSVSTGTLGDFTVVDDRAITKKGWDLTTTVAEFKHGTDTIANTALGLAPKAVTNSGPGTPALGTTQVAGTAVYASKFAELASGNYAAASKFNADLTFKAPLGSPEGTYNSTLTLTLVSK